VDYDPVKDRLGGFFWKSPARTKAFYRLLDTVFLRSWYVRRALRQRIEGMGDRPVRVLDAGTGFGQYAYWLVDTFPNVEVTAVDVKDDYLERAQAFMAQTPYAGRVAFEKADLTLPLEYADTFDLALSVDVMEHIEDDRAVFRNVLAALKPGGFLVTGPFPLEPLSKTVGKSQRLAPLIDLESTSVPPDLARRLGLREVKEPFEGSTFKEFIAEKILPFRYQVFEKLAQPDLKKIK